MPVNPCCRTTVYFQARNCDDSSLLDAWFALADYTAIGSQSFYIPFLQKCCYFAGDFNATRGTLYTQSDVTTYANCAACGATSPPCYHGGVATSYSPTIHTTLPTGINWGSLTPPAGSGLTPQSGTAMAGNGTIPSWTAVAAGFPNVANIAGYETNSDGAVLKSAVIGGCTCWVLDVLFFQSGGDAIARWIRRATSALGTDIYGAYSWQQNFKDASPSPIVGTGTNGTTFLMVTP